MFRALKRKKGGNEVETIKSFFFLFFNFFCLETFKVTIPKSECFGPSNNALTIPKSKCFRFEVLNNDSKVEMVFVSKCLKHDSKVEMVFALNCLKTRSQCFCFSPVSKCLKRDSKVEMFFASKCLKTRSQNLNGVHFELFETRFQSRNGLGPNEITIPKSKCFEPQNSEFKRFYSRNVLGPKIPLSNGSQVEMFWA